MSRLEALRSLLPGGERRRTAKKTTQEQASSSEEQDRYPHIQNSPSTVASQLAGMFLEEQVRKGKTIEIPSLGIKITKENLRNP